MLVTHNSSQLFMKKKFSSHIYSAYSNMRMKLGNIKCLSLKFSLTVHLKKKDGSSNLIYKNTRDERLGDNVYRVFRFFFFLWKRAYNIYTDHYYSAISK